MITQTQNRIREAFASKKNILNIYFTAGFPRLEDTTRVLKALAASGADMIEIGVPFSDPLADGPTIQQSSQKAIDNGMTIEVLFRQLEGIRSEVNVPLILMGYLNPVLQYGVEKFCRQCKQVGIDGLIIPDLPLQEYEEEYRTLFAENGLANVFLITPQTSEDRIRRIDAVSDSFIYMVSSASTTGAKQGISQDQEAYFKRIQGMNLRNPRLIGFGISDRASFSKATQYAEGAIIGSAFINLLEKSNDIEKEVAEFVKGIK